MVRNRALAEETNPRQRQLPFSRALVIAVRSLRARLARSVLTLTTIVVAIGFLCSVWMNGVLEPPSRAAMLAAQGLADEAASGPPARAGLLLTLSLLVCMVGISNAMLMSVMERFREIGTMKCLGALDSFILKLFLLESILLGAVGSFFGVIVGFGLTVATLRQHYGATLWDAAPWGAAGWIAASCFGIGIFITAAAAAYPALRAARMEPIAAMRVDV